RLCAGRQAFLDRFWIRTSEFVHAAPDMRDAGISQSKIRILLDGFFVHRKRVFELALAKVVSAAKKEVVGLRIYGGLARDHLFFLRRQRDLERFGNAQRNFLLNSEYVFHVAVVAFGPDGMAGRTLHELCCDAQAVSGTAD